MRLEYRTVQELNKFPPEGLLGRRKIKTAVDAITSDNVADVLANALTAHYQNVREINYLWDYYRGKQDIRLKEKYTRENINNKVVVNRANEIVTFKTAYLLNEPIQYVSAGGNDRMSKEITRLNTMMRDEDKESLDKELVDWIHICGVGVRLVLPDSETGVEIGAPFCIYTLDPREAFVIYSSRIGQRPMAGVIIQKDENDRPIYTVYTSTECFYVSADETVRREDHFMGDIPLVEYENNVARMGAFESVISILNNINMLASNAVDSVQDFVNGFDVFQNCDIDDGSYSELGIGGKAVKIKTVTQGMEAKVYRVASELNQGGVQQQIDSMTDDYLTICGMPNRNGGSSTSDTGQAVIFRDGWSEAESRAKDSEKLFTRSERKIIKLVLSICSAYEEYSLNIGLKDIEVDFTRKSLNNLQSKFQCLSEGLANDMIHPEMMYNAFGDIFGDKAKAYQMGMQWHQEQQEQAETELQKQLDIERERVRSSDNAGSVPSGGRDDQATE